MQKNASTCSQAGDNANSSSYKRHRDDAQAGRTAPRKVRVSGGKASLNAPTGEQQSKGWSKHSES
jgi:hypothetical protein